MAVAALMSEFPWIFPSLESKPPQYFHGFMKICDVDHEIHLTTPKFPSVKGMSLRTNVTLSSLIDKHRHQLLQIDDESGTVVEYLKNFQKICNSVAAEKMKTNEPSLPQDSHFESLLSHLEAIGWDKVSEVAPDFTSITLELSDDKGRMHMLKIKIPQAYPEEEPIVEAYLPKEFTFSWNRTEGLSSIISAWEDDLSYLQKFWDVLDDLDETAMVLDPPSPGRRHTARRLLLSNRVSMQLTISVDHPCSLPQCQLLGSVALTAPLNKLLTEKYPDWDSERSIVDNLEFILGVEVIKRTDKADMGEDNWNTECAVCYSLHFDESLPDLTCDHCSQSFHIQCLYEWLRSLPNSRQSMNFIFGECPYCTQLISCKVPV